MREDSLREFVITISILLISLYLMISSWIVIIETDEKPLGTNYVIFFGGFLLIIVYYFIRKLLENRFGSPTQSVLREPTMNN